MGELLKQLIILCPLVFLAGIIDSIAGGGGLITLPAYLFIGLPPHLATATNKCSSTFGTMLSTLRFLKGKRIVYLPAVCAAAAALFGSPIGANLNMLLSEKYLQYVLIAGIPVIAIILFIKKDFGEENNSDQLSKKQIIVYSVLSGFIIGVYDGFLGPGTGSFLILAFTIFLKFDMVTASGNAKVVNLASNIAALITYALHGNIVWALGVPALFFGIAGNWIGSGLALKKGQKIIRPLFFVVLCLLMVKLATDLLI